MSSKLTIDHCSFQICCTQLPSTVLQIENRLSEIWPHLHLPFVLTATSLSGKGKAWVFGSVSFQHNTPSPVKPETYRYSAIHLMFPLGHLLVHQRRTLDLQQPVWNKFKRRLGIIMKCFNTSFPLWVCSVWAYIQYWKQVNNLNSVNIQNICGFTTVFLLAG